MKTEHAQSERLIMKEESRYINLSKLAEPAPTNLTESNFTKNDCLTVANFTQNDCNPSAPVHRQHIFVIVMFIIFLILCCIMLAK